MKIRGISTINKDTLHTIGIALENVKSDTEDHDR